MMGARGDERAVGREQHSAGSGMPIQTSIAAAVSLLLAFALTPVARSVALRLGAVDRPGGRRVHTKVTPRMGGLSIVLAHLAAIGSVWAYSSRSGAAPGASGPVIGFLCGGILIAAVGAVDDVRAIGAKKKLAGQIVAASVAWAAGARIEAFNLPWIGDFEFGPVASFVATVLWIVAFVNAVNLIDGLDGLASGIVLFAAITNTIVAFVTGNALAAVLNAALGGAVLGFLYFNFNPATIFLGDTGSMFLGYCLGAASLMTGRQKESTVVALLVPLVALGVPLTDTLFTMVRRFLERRPIFAADRGHIHHRLLDLGLTHRRVVLFLYAMSVLTCVAALGAAFGHDWQAGIAIAVAAAVVLAGARFAGYFRTQIQGRAREPLTHEVELLRRTIPELLRAERAGLPAFWGRLEALILRDGSFVSADLVADGGVVWSWGSDTAQLGEDVEYAYLWALGGNEHRLRFVVRSAAGERSERLDALLQLVVDRAAAEIGPAPAWTEPLPAADGGIAATASDGAPLQRV